jgi:hypothetical protein
VFSVLSNWIVIFILFLIFVRFQGIDAGSMLFLTPVCINLKDARDAILYLVLVSSGFYLPSLILKERGLVRPEGLGKFKKIASSGLEPTTFRFVA